MKYQFMPMFWGDFFANTLHLTAQEAGAYLFLIGHAWEHDGKIAVSDLQRVARISNFHWPKVRQRLIQFFDTSMDANIWHHGRVHAELIKAAEISNKRKDAALQMHSKRTASVSVLHPHLHLQLPSKDASLGKGSEASQAEPRQGSSPDPGLDYRSPPRKKVDNPLAPLPDKKSNP